MPGVVAGQLLAHLCLLGVVRNAEGDVMHRTATLVMPRNVGSFVEVDHAAFRVASHSMPDDRSFTANLAEAVTGADLVQENGPERIDFKRKLYGQLDALLLPDVIIASSSSGLKMSDIQLGAKLHPDRCVIGHPFNPPHLIPLVEVVGGKKTSEETIQHAMEFYKSIGKKAVRLNKEMPGHVANRLQGALAREVYYLVAEDVRLDAGGARRGRGGLQRLLGRGDQVHLVALEDGVLRIRRFQRAALQPRAHFIGNLDAVAIQDGQRIRGPRVSGNRHEHAAARGERVEDASVVCLEADATHRAREAEFREVSGLALKDADQRTSRGDGANAGQIDPLSRRTEGAFDEGRGIRSVLAEDGERLDGKARPNQRVDALLRPGEILKNAHGESFDVRLDHGGNVSR